MTEIMSVSAATAAYATEPLKASARLSGSTNTAETTHTQILEARQTDNAQHARRMNIVGPPALALFFLTAGERGSMLQQATMREAEEAYFSDPDAEATGDSTDEQSGGSPEDASDDEEFQEGQSEILALPAPASAS